MPASRCGGEAARSELTMLVGRHRAALVTGPARTAGPGGRSFSRVSGYWGLQYLRGYSLRPCVAHWPSDLPKGEASRTSVRCPVAFEHRLIVASCLLNLRGHYLASESSVVLLVGKPNHPTISLVLSVPFSPLCWYILL